MFLWAFENCASSMVKGVSAQASVASTDIKTEPSELPTCTLVSEGLLRRSQASKLGNSRSERWSLTASCCRCVACIALKVLHTVLSSSLCCRPRLLQTVSLQESKGVCFSSRKVKTLPQSSGVSDTEACFCAAIGAGDERALLSLIQSSCAPHCVVVGAQRSSNVERSGYQEISYTCSAEICSIRLCCLRTLSKGAKACVLKILKEKNRRRSASWQETEEEATQEENKKGKKNQKQSCWYMPCSAAMRWAQYCAKQMAVEQNVHKSWYPFCSLLQALQCNLCLSQMLSAVLCSTKA